MESGDNEPLNLMSVSTLCALDSFGDFRFFHLDHFFLFGDFFSLEFSLVRFSVVNSQLFCLKSMSFFFSLFITFFDRYSIRYKILGWQYFCSHCKR